MIRCNGQVVVFHRLTGSSPSKPQSFSSRRNPIQTYNLSKCECFSRSLYQLIRRPSRQSPSTNSVLVGYIHVALGPLATLNTYPTVGCNGECDAVKQRRGGGEGKGFAAAARTNKGGKSETGNERVTSLDQ